jgi:hypothetical protein
MANEIATWYEVTFKNEGTEENPKLTAIETPIGTGNTLNFSGVEAGSPSVIKCIRIKFNRRVSKLKFWLVNNISGTTSSDGGVFGEGWTHGYHIRGGVTDSPLLDSNISSNFKYEYATKPENGKATNPYGQKGTKNENTMVYLPRDPEFFTKNPDYSQWGAANADGNFGSADANVSENNEVWYTPYIYLVVTPPLSADGGSRTGWGYRISFLYA